MTLRELRLGSGECSDLETGARFFAALAFPGPHEEAARRDAERAWAGQYLHEANRVDESSAPFTDQRLNGLAAADPAWCKAAVRTSRRRLRDRMAAARTVRPWVRDCLGGPQPLPSGLTKFTQRQIAHYLSSSDPERADNFQKRVLRLSRPVLHLAVAADLQCVASGGEKVDHGVDLLEIDWFAAVVGLSNEIKTRLRADKRFGVRELNLLHLVWTA